MIVDVLRSCYSVDWKYGDGDDSKARVLWRWCEPGATPLPFPTIFNSQNYRDQLDHTSAVGEQWPGNRKWSNGAFIPGYSQGPPCGSEQQFLSGCGPVVPATPPRDPATGIPDCCRAAPAPSCIPWVYAPRFAYWPGVSPFPGDVRSFGATSQVWYEPGTLNGFHWDDNPGATCLGKHASTARAFLNNGTGGSWLLTPTAYDAVTGGSTWSVPSTSGYRPGQSFTMLAVQACYPYGAAGGSAVPYLTAGPFTNKVPDYGDWYSSWTWIDPATGQRGFVMYLMSGIPCGSTQAGHLQSFDYGVSGDQFDAPCQTGNAPGISTFWTASNSTFLPSTRVTIDTH